MKSAIGQGSIFTFTLPLATGSVAEADRLGSILGPSVPTQSGQLLDVALVEDNPSARVMMEAMLAPHRVTCYETGAAALRELPKTKPHVVVLDISLPDMSGIEVLKGLRSLKASRSIPVIALSAHAMSGNREKLLTAGFSAYFSKPITDAAGLQRAVEQLARNTSFRLRRQRTKLGNKG